MGKENNDRVGKREKVEKRRASTFCPSLLENLGGWQSTCHFGTRNGTARMIYIEFIIYLTYQFTYYKASMRAFSIEESVKFIKMFIIY